MTQEAETYQQTVTRLNADLAKMAGQFSAITKYLDESHVPNIEPVHKRVKLLAIMYQQALLANKHVSLIQEATVGRMRD